MWIDDQILSHHEKKTHIEIFVPEETSVILGSGNDAALEVNLEACHFMGVPVLRRYGGGGTVVLYPGCVVVSIGCWVKDPFKNHHYFKLLNQAIIDALSLTWPNLSKLSQAGISDIVFGEKKIAGTSMFRSRNYLLYQASILVDLDHKLVGSVLRHPTKEPDYRKGRSHKDFLSSLAESEATINDSKMVEGSLKSHFLQAVEKRLSADLIDPIQEQMAALRARLERARVETV
jgi:lipoate-protein ligase A